MRNSKNRMVRFFAILTLIFSLLVVGPLPVAAQEYPALKSVQGLKTLVDYGLGSPEMAVIIFPGLRDVYRDKNVTSLPTAPSTVIVFHGEAVKLLSTDNQDEKVAEMIRQFKKDGVRMEVCMYAVEVLGVDPATLMPEIERVANGFISVAGYQAQGYSLIAVP